MAFSAPIPVAELEATPETAGRVLEEQLWPEVGTQFRGLLSRRGAVAAALAALGLGGVAVRGVQARQRRSRGQPWWRQTPKARIRLPRRRSRPRLSLRGRRKRR